MSINTALYRQVAYLKSSGTQYIDTGIACNSDTTAWEIKIDTSGVSQVNAYATIIGARQTQTLDRHYALCVQNYGTFLGGNGTVDIGSYGNFQGCNIWGYNLFGNKKYTRDGDALVTCTQSFTTPTLWLLNTHWGVESAQNRCCMCKLYYCKIWNNGSLVRSYVPCIRRLDGVAGMYDEISNAFFANAGTGNFDYSPHWAIDTSLNSGYPLPLATGEPISYVETGIYSDWRITEGCNNGYPHIFRSLPATYIQPIESEGTPPIRVYGQCESDFSHNGLRILSPTRCEETEELNGSWEVVLEHPIDEEGNWTALTLNAILKVPTRRRGAIKTQLFRIYRAERIMEDNGTMLRRVYARHVFYDLNDVILDNAELPPNTDGGTALQWLLSHTYKPVGDPEDITLRYMAYSNIHTEISGIYDGIAITAAICGDENSVMAKLGGSLFRDNFYFSIKSDVEGAMDNAFALRYSVDMISVSEDIDYSDYASCVIADCNFGVRQTARYYNAAISRPHHVTRRILMQYDDYDKQRFFADTLAYLNTIKLPKISYHVSFANLTQSELYAGYNWLQSCEIGDTGSITNEVLDIETIQRIVRKTADILTGTVLSVDLGSMPSSLTRKKPYSATIKVGEKTAEEKQLEELTRATIGSSIANLERYPIEMLKSCTIVQLEGG